MSAPGICVEIVDEVSAAHDQDAFVSQWRKFPTHLEMERCQLGFIDAELYDRDVGFWIHMPEHRPRPVIESPGVVEGYWYRRQ